MTHNSRKNCRHCEVAESQGATHIHPEGIEEKIELIKHMEDTLSTEDYIHFLREFLTTHHQELQKAREEERERLFGEIEQFKSEVATMDYCDDFKDGIYATIEHILSNPFFESVLTQSELDQPTV